MNDPELVYTRTPARYAEGKVALQVPGVGMWKSLAAIVLTTQIAPNARYSNREHSYIVSPRQADKFESTIESLRLERQEKVAA